MPRRACSASTMFSRTDSSATMPSGLRSSGHIARPWRIACAGLSRRTGVAVDAQLAAVAACRGRTAAAPARCGPSRAGRRGRRPRRAAGSRSTGRSWPRRPDAARLAAAARRRCRRWRRGAPSRPAAALSSRPTIAVISACGGSSAFRYSPTQLAVAQHRDAIGDRVHLVEEVGDEEDRQAFVAQPAQHGEQALDLLLVEARGRLVEDQHARLDAQRAGDRHHLLHRDRVARQQPRHVDVEVQAREQRARVGVHARPVDAPQPGRAAARIAAGEDVLGHRQVRAEVDLLVDRADAQPLRRRRRARAGSVSPPSRSSPASAG